MLGIAIFLGFLVGFMTCALLRSWSDSTDPWKPPQPRRSSEPRPESPPDVLDNYRPTTGAIAEQLYLLGLQHGTGAKVTLANREAVLEAAGRDLQRGAEVITIIVGCAYVDGARELRDALGQHSGIDAEALDEAVQVALARKRREDVMRKEQEDAAAQRVPE